MPVWLMFLRQWTVEMYMVEWKAEGSKMANIKVFFTTVTATDKCLSKK
jgi:hypothetical protein